MLVLAGIEVIFSTEAGTVLCCEFVLEKVGHTAMLLLLPRSLLTACGDLSSSSHCPPARGLGVHKELGGNTAGTADPN